MPVSAAYDMTTGYTESFTGAPAALSVPWTQQRTSGTVNKNGAGVGIGSVDALDLFAYWSANTFSNDQYSQVRIAGGLSNNTQFVELIVRASGNTDRTYNGYAFYSDGLADPWHTALDRITNGTWTALKTFSTTFAPGDVMKISAIGTTITCYKNGVAIGSVTDAALASGAPGVGVYGNRVTLDDWQGGPVLVAAAPVATVAVSPASASVVAGTTKQLTATMKDASNNVLIGRAVTWGSSNTGAATVDANGLVTAVAADTATITATSEGKSGMSTITVTPPPAPVATVTVSPPSASVAGGGTQQLTATTKDAGGNTVTGRAVTWSSGAPAVATVNASTGLVSTVSPGTATITATSEGQTGTSAITVTPAPVPVATVTVSPPSASVVAGGATQQLTATVKDASSNVLTGRSITWSSSGITVATVNASGVVTGVSQGGPVTISATSEGKIGTAAITVTPAPVASITISPSPSTVNIGGMQSLNATLRDANSNVLTGRIVAWSSDAPSVASINATTGVVTGLSVGSATITATSEGQSGRSTVTVASVIGPPGPLHVSTDNRRYFADPSGRVVYLTGSEYWKTIQDNGPSNPPPVFDYSGFLNFLQQHNHNFTRLYMWEQSRWSAETSLSHWFSPTLYVRTGPGIGADGGAQFDLTQINPAYLARVRQRAIDAGARGIYVSIMLFDGWSVGVKGSSTAGNPWLGHPFNSANNINGINGDPNGDASGAETQTLSIPAVTALQDTYVKAVIDAVNDLDNVIYEISNESEQSSDAWQYHMIDLVRSYEASKPKQHAVGMTVPYPTVPQGTNSDVLNSTADWMSMNGNPDNPVVATGNKVSLWDTDHLCGICGSVGWVWKSLTRGHNPLFMDGYDGSPGVGDPLYDPSAPVWEAIRKNMGYARSYAIRMDLARAVPHGELAQSGYCLAIPGVQYLAYSPGGTSISVNLSAVPSNVNLTVEWFNTSTGVATVVGTVAGGGSRNLRPPASGGTVVFVH